MAQLKTYQSVLKIKDHSVTGEEFELVENSDFGFLETTPQPNLKKISDYYKSDNYISHTNSKRNLFEKAYHLVRKISLKHKLRLLKSLSLNGVDLLDVGCGTGDFLQAAQKNNWKVIGIEPNNQARGIANIKTNNAVFETEHLLKIKEQRFDVITFWHVLEHLPNLEHQIKLFKKILKPNGVLIIAVPNYQSYDALYYKQYWAAFDVPRHLWHFDKKSVSKLFNTIDMRVIKTKPMYFDAFYVCLLSEKYKTGKMNILKGILIGLLSNLKSLQTKEASSLIYIIKNN